MYGPTNPIFTAGNDYLLVSNLQGSATTATLNGLPLCTSDGTATGPICLRVYSAGGGGGGGGQAVTPTFFSLIAYDLQTIPAGSKGYGFAVTSGTANIGSATNVPAGASVSDPNTLSVDVLIVMDPVGTGFGYYNT